MKILVIVGVIFSNVVFGQIVDSNKVFILMKADTLFKVGKYKESIRYFKKLENQDYIPKEKIYEKIYTAYWLLGRKKKALKYVKIAIDNGKHYWYKGQYENDKLIQKILNIDNNLNYKNKLENQVNNFLLSDSLCQYSNLKDSLILRKKLDQHYRNRNVKTKEEWKKQKEWDKNNRMFLQSIIDSLGVWPGFIEVGKSGESAVFLIAQHSEDSLFQIQCINLMKKQSAISNIYSSHLALLTDRYYLKIKGYQIFGSQIEMVKNKAKPKKMWNYKYVDLLRYYFGLPPLSYYLNQMTEMNTKKNN